ncbi:dUTP diphosphatase [Gammaproteobacteria bacterium]|nr:dUTP diphosphatase [Gammaproteobacteria bacterium]
MQPLQIKLLDPRIGQEVPLPQYQTSGSAGIDLYACLQQTLTIKPGECYLIASGISIYIQDPSFCGLIFPRSGLGHKKGLILGNSTGVIDADYQGEIKISFWNRGLEDQVIQPLDRIAQFVLMPIGRANLTIVDTFNTQSERGEGGFGSTNHKTQLV